jgi:hypothetical protein
VLLALGLEFETLTNNLEWVNGKKNLAGGFG